MVADEAWWFSLNRQSVCFRDGARAFSLSLPRARETRRERAQARAPSQKRTKRDAERRRETRNEREKNCSPAFFFVFFVLASIPFFNLSPSLRQKNSETSI